MLQNEGKNEGLAKDVIQMIPMGRFQEAASQICSFIDVTTKLYNS